MLLTRFAGAVERKNYFRIRMMLQVELQQVLVTRKGLDTYLYRAALTMMLLFLVISMTIAQCQTHLCWADPSHTFQ